MPWWLVSLRALRCVFSLQAVQSNLSISALTQSVTPRLGTKLGSRSVAEDSAATADWSVRGGSDTAGCSSSRDSDAGTRAPTPQRRLNSKTTVHGAPGDQSRGDKPRRSRRTRLEENLMRRSGEHIILEKETPESHPRGSGVGGGVDWNWGRVWSEALAPRRAGGESFGVTTSRAAHPAHPPLRHWRRCLL